MNGFDRYTRMPFDYGDSSVMSEEYGRGDETLSRCSYCQANGTGAGRACSCKPSVLAVRQAFLGAAERHPIVGVILSAWDQLPREEQSAIADAIARRMRS